MNQKADHFRPANRYNNSGRSAAYKFCSQWLPVAGLNLIQTAARQHLQNNIRRILTAYSRTRLQYEKSSDNRIGDSFQYR